ncbi:PRTRC system protein E [Pseudorhodoferax sp. Leaf267]|uniref:PRTRC system protein E n=1 Tax=Pseudorhodoferax sp. Leaf267 TaxID=1736316 RepID=UPI0006F43AF1|nr:PRTRC system protein E [Pseudorhodoferax sp. Leaf267]KQP15169.1 PRTRC system protein E [Pseudorhodoferax sp. Leaf267]
MTTFEELYALATGATLTMVLSADVPSGRLTVHVIPRPRQDGGEPALAQALSLTATPQEFDAGFVQALRGYRVVRQSLEQQAEATREVIDAARTASVQRAGDAASKATAAKPVRSTKPLPDRATAAADDEDTDDDMPLPRAAVAPAAPDGGSLDLFG